jgi:putative membrane protein
MGSEYPMRYPAVLLGLFLVIFVTLGISPASRSYWWLANVPILAALAALVLTTRRFRFTKTAYSCLFVLLVLKEVEAHYVDWLVPGEWWVERSTGFTLEQLFGLQRDVYVQMINILFGLLLLPPTIELMRILAPPRGWWRWVQAPLIVLALSALCELFAGAIALAAGSSSRAWGAQMNMAYALAGALLSQLLIRAGSARSSEL